MNPRRLPRDIPLHLLPDPIGRGDGNFQTLDALLGTDKTDKDSPGYIQQKMTKRKKEF